MGGAEHGLAVGGEAGVADELGFPFTVRADRRDEQLVGYGGRVRVCHQALTDLDVDVETGPVRLVGVFGDGDSVGDLVVEVAMHRHAHGGV